MFSKYNLNYWDIMSHYTVCADFDIGHIPILGTNKCIWDFSGENLSGNIRLEYL
jgi:hypothetical protein